MLEAKEAEKHEHLGQAKLMVSKKKQKLRSVKEKTVGLESTINETAQEIQALRQTVFELEQKIESLQADSLIANQQ